MNEVIRCLLSDMDTDEGRLRYAEMVARNTIDPANKRDYAKAADFFRQRLARLMVAQAAIAKATGSK